MHNRGQTERRACRGVGLWVTFVAESQFSHTWSNCTLVKSRVFYIFSATFSGLSACGWEGLRNRNSTSACNACRCLRHRESTISTKPSYEARYYEIMINYEHIISKYQQSVSELRLHHLHPFPKNLAHRVSWGLHPFHPLEHQELPRPPLNFSGITGIT